MSCPVGHIVDNSETSQFANGLQVDNKMVEGFYVARILRNFQSKQNRQGTEVVNSLMRFSLVEFAYSFIGTYRVSFRWILFSASLSRQIFT